MRGAHERRGSRRAGPRLATTVSDHRPLVWRRRLCERAADGGRVGVGDGHDQAQSRSPGRARRPCPLLLAPAHPGRVGSGILRDVGREGRKRPRGVEHPFHAGNLPDTAPAPGALAQVSVDLSRFADGDIRPPPHGAGTFESVPGSHHGAGRARARPPRSAVPGAARQHQRPPAPGLRDLERADPARERDRIRRHGGVLRQLRPTRATPSWSGVNGVFGERMCEVASRHGAEVVRVDAEWGEPIDPDRLLAAHPAPAIIAVVHAETSTGVRNDIEPLGRGKGDALLLVDMVTSLGGIEVAVDDWSVDIAYSGTQKCLGVPPGLSPLTVSERALERIGRAAVELVPGPQPPGALRQRRLGRRAGLPPHGAGGDGGGAARRSRRAPRRGARGGVGAPCRVRPAAAGRVGRPRPRVARGRPTTACRSSPRCGSRPASTRPRCGASSSRTYGIEIGAGAGRLAGQIWRIGCMGHTARRRNVLALLGALKEVLGR